jgi:hypothetical protein
LIPGNFSGANIFGARAAPARDINQHEKKSESHKVYVMVRKTHKILKELKL